jgi:hypothetical protein
VRGKQNQCGCQKAPVYALNRHLSGNKWRIVVRDRRSLQMRCAFFSGAAFPKIAKRVAPIVAKKQCNKLRGAATV